MEEFVYHFIKKKRLANIKRYGLCSPRKLLEVDRSSFMDTSYKIYKGRTALRLKIDEAEVTPNDILIYLDKSPYHPLARGSEYIHFSLLPMSDYHPKLRQILKDDLQLSISYKKMLRQRVIVMDGQKDVVVLGWSTVLQDNYLNKVKQQAAISPKPTNYKRVFAHVKHIGVPAYHIPYNKIKSITKI